MRVALRRKVLLKGFTVIESVTQECYGVTLVRGETCLSIINVGVWSALRWGER